jgi:hypothetical protein
MHVCKHTSRHGYERCMHKAKNATHKFLRFSYIEIVAHDTVK